MRRLHWVLSQFGMDPARTARALRAVPRFVSGYVRFRSKYEGTIHLFPCLHDWSDEAGHTRSEYFWQDLYVAQKIHDAKPHKHVDVGSRIDGFVAHLASFREVEVFDIRPIRGAIPGVTFRQVDILAGVEILESYCDSLSCLHALEHFGLGRYGDPIDPKGHEKGFRNLVRMLKDGGTFYLSVPCGRERVEFNGHRILDPQMVLAWARREALSLESCAVITSEGIAGEGREALTRKGRTWLDKTAYVLWLFTFRKEM